MASLDEVSRAFQLLIGAGLDYAPSTAEIPTRAAAWVELLQDVPGLALVQAAKDLAVSSPRFPSIPVVRAAAYQVKVHNGQSAAANPWKDDSHPRRVSMVRFSPEAESLIAALEEKYYDDGLPTDAELAEIDRLTGGAL
jgi:hypothetical protein